MVDTVLSRYAVSISGSSSLLSPPEKARPIAEKKPPNASLLSYSLDAFLSPTSQVDFPAEPVVVSTSSTVSATSVVTLFSGTVSATASSN